MVRLAGLARVGHELRVESSLEVNDVVGSLGFDQFVRDTLDGVDVAALLIE